MRPQPTEKEIQFILDAISEYLTVKVSLAVGYSSMHSATAGCRIADLVLLYITTCTTGTLVCVTLCRTLHVYGRLPVQNS